MSRYQDQLNEFSKRVLEAIEKGDAPWQKPWKEGQLLELPKNLTTDQNYKGVNLINLAMSGFNDPRWMTFQPGKRDELFCQKRAKTRHRIFLFACQIGKRA